MALQSSGEIKISQIQSELDYASNKVNASLKSLSDGSGTFFGHTINTANAASDRPDEVAPHAMSEFYSYDHDAGVSWSTSGNTGLNVGGESGQTDMANSFATLTLSPSLFSKKTVISIDCVVILAIVNPSTIVDVDEGTV